MSPEPILSVAHEIQRPTSVPPGWQHNPTSVRRRLLLAALALTGLVVATYLTLFQIGVLDDVWDPFFDARAVLELTAPVPDALAGVAAYAAGLVLLAVGGRDRWRSLPWACLALGIGEARAAWQHVTRARTRGVNWGDAVWGRAGHVS
jgi:hypothetical protein